MRANKRMNSYTDLLAVVVALSMMLFASTVLANVNVPNFNCGGLTLQKVKKDGITLGIAPDSPYTYLNKNNKPTGADWRINVAVLKWLGVPQSKIHYSIMPYSALIPSLLSGKIDVITDGIHENKKRLKVISFSGPSWWYGPAIIVNKNNKPNITSYKDLKNYTVGALNGTIAAQYLRAIGAKIDHFKDNFSEFTSLAQQKVPAVLDDQTKFVHYMKTHPDSPLETLNVQVPKSMILKYGYGYVRYGFRKKDCSLRAAYTRGLAEMRANGTVLHIIKKWGFGPSNVFDYHLH